MPTAGALLSAGLSALILAAPVLIGLLTFLALQPQGLLMEASWLSYTDAVLGSVSFWWGNINSLLGTPHYFLACCCVSLALRGAVLARAVPASMSLAACLAASVAYDPWTFGQDPLNALLFGPGSNGNALYLLAGVSLLLAAVAWACRWLAVRPNHTLPGWLLLLALIGLPCMLSVLQLFVYVDLSGWPLAASIIHNFYASFLPDLQFITPEPPYEGPWPFQVRAYGLTLDPLSGASLLVILRLLTLLFWAWAALRCLDAARGIRQ